MPPLLNHATSSTRPPARARLSSWVLWALAALALLVLLGRLQDALLLFMRSPINPDVLGFASDARQMHAFYDCPTREPFHVLWFKVGLLLSSDIELVGRVTTMLQTLLAGAMVFLFGRRFFGDAVALAAVSLFSINPVVHYYGVSGLRAPLFCAMLLLFALLLFDSWRPRRVAVQSILAGVAAGLLILTRVYAYAIVAGAFLLYAVCERAWRPERRASCLRHLGIAALALCLLVVPDILFRPASPIHGQTVNFFRNLELYGDVGTWQTDPPVSHFQYLFGDHTVSEVAWRIGANYLRYAYQYLPFFLRGYEVLWWLLPVGIVA
ncbi:MAG: glycosyltransferase family 39 protein, partial [Acidobacteriota bacterium]